MKIFNALQIKQCDQYTIQKEDITSLELMEKAANRCFEWLKDKYSNNYSYYVFCGRGNNGGDGLALSRILFNNNYEVETFVIQSDDEFSEEATCET